MTRPARDAARGAGSVRARIVGMQGFEPERSTGERYHALTRPAGSRSIEVLDQRALPHATVTLRIGDARAAADAIRDMIVRGAGSPRSSAAPHGPCLLSGFGRC